MIVPTLSIVIPCLDEAEIIQKLLESLQSTRGRGVELILVDGGSDDSTVAKPLVDQLLVTAPGRALQMNAGARIAKSDLLWFLHADSMVNDDFPEAIRTALQSSECRWGRFDVTLSGRAPFFRVIEFMMNWRSRLTGIATGDQGIFVQRGLFEQVGGFPEIPLMEDIRLSALLRKYAWPIALRQRLMTSSRRWEQSGILRTVLLMWRLRLAFYFGVDPKRLAQRYR
ncbi:TIGR04283 family arsenosugar biosynthesis glycosyltransferase [Sedimenticola selenatireducens]|uniref:Glycosyltransferase n=1 Tax=Sedimenticola selenatireducens TaxID=191960 RepID=A0A558E151_9GAMM|nr:TIGR04283 family arsenosugar biosynthesis glycosyltransferase [Sedimenticola selenatireducens]TVO75268.1 glycosyltransferase [Sedimenticola selenatireducens]TVT66879.1 MAG: glycosyltransferase [Sedimenticola selenatireducens]